MMFSSSKTKTFALKKDNYISISLSSVKTQIKSVKKDVAKPVKKIIKKTSIEDSPIAEAPEVDIGNLFSDVWTQDIKKINKKVKKIDNKRYQKIEKRIKTLKVTNKASVASQVINKINTKEISDKNTNASTANEVNEYLAKIQALVYQYFYPPQNSQGHSVKAVIELSSIGKVLDFRILNYSANQALNEECDKIKSRLIGVVFPVNPQNKSDNYIVILTSKE